MELLIIGGTVFLGRAIVDEALSRGHSITLFNRGRHNPELFPEVEKVRGDRDGGLEALGDRRFDAVIDTCGYLPRLVSDSASRLAGSCDHYTFISSLSVYAPPSEGATGPFDESAPLLSLDDPSTEEVTGETYGGLKVLCEEAAEAAMPGRTLIIRPGIIVGPHDPSDRFTYWVARPASGGSMIVPEPRDARIEFTDVRDLASWTLSAVEQRYVGSYNVSGPSENGVAFDAFIETCLDAARDQTTDGCAEPVWLDEQTLEKYEVAHWSELPLCVPSAMLSSGPAAHSSARAIAGGLTFRPADETVRDTHAWWGTLDRDLLTGLSREKEQGVIDALRGC